MILVIKICLAIYSVAAFLFTPMIMKSYLKRIAPGENTLAFCLIMILRSGIIFSCLFAIGIIVKNRMLWYIGFWVSVFISIMSYLFLKILKV
jgi:hypothetical protein